MTLADDIKTIREFVLRHVPYNKQVPEVTVTQEALDRVEKAIHEPTGRPFAAIAADRRVKPGDATDAAA
jgi:hypothetical protein